MYVEIRKTLAGTEYWNAKEKKTELVPAGQESPFEVTKNPKSMIMSADLVSESDGTAEDGQVVKGFGSMSIKQLREYAAANNIEIPADIKKKEDIIPLLS